MLNIPPDILARFVSLLEKRSIPSTRHNYYKKWLRYYLDFCAKYLLQDTSSESLPRFLTKLRDKKQTEAQIKEAAHAVSLYLDLDSLLKKVTFPAIDKKTRSATGKTKMHYITPSAASAKESPVPVTPPQAAADTKPAWNIAVAELARIIKTRHYSPKTLKSYRHWVLKLRGFRRDRNPASLTPEDVKEFLSHLAVTCNVSASSQNQAFNALLFFFRHVLNKEFGEIRDVVRAKRNPISPWCSHGRRWIQYRFPAVVAHAGEKSSSPALRGFRQGPL